MIENPFWWPLDLSPGADHACEALRRELSAAPVALDVAALDLASEALVQAMVRHVGDIVDRDGLPHLCHIINGWGDGRFAGAPLSDQYGAFVHRDAAGQPFLLQCDPEGDFHPWQSLAYALMAGTHPDRQLAPGGVTLRALARHSRFLNTAEGIELGHLLFALGMLGPDRVDPPFTLRLEVCDRERLMERAVEAHYHGGFEVCRKFHLTEGLCAMAAGFADHARYRDTAAGFLGGQLDILWPLAAILSEARRWIARGLAAPPTSLVGEMREALVMGDFFENHCYYAGHLIELAGFAEIMGYRIDEAHRSAMHYVLNEVNTLLPAYLPQVSFLDCFLHLGHYRRAATLRRAIESARAAGLPPSAVDVTAYTCDFDALGAQGAASCIRAAAPAGTAAATPPPGLATGVYAVAASAKAAREEFAAAVEEYAARAASGFEPRGGFDHFRRMGPPEWPRAVHYELLDYGTGSDGGAAGIGAEIHLESEAVRCLAGALRELAREAAPHFPGRTVEWDPSWYQGRGRLRVVFPPDAPAAEVAAGMATLVAVTRGRLAPAASAVLVRPSEVDAPFAAPLSPTPLLP